MHDRVVKKRYRLCRITLVGLLAGHGIASAQEQPAGASSATASEHALQSYPPCDRTPTDGDVAGAKGAFQAGAAAYNEADYERAITYWEDAFRRDCTATPLLLNLARAYESSLQYASAILALQTFNERNQDSPQTAQIERRIERLEELLKAQTPPAAPVIVPEPEPAEPEPVTPAPTQNTKPAEKATRNQAPLYVSIVGGGVALLSGLLYLKELHDLEGFEDKCGGTDRKCPDDATTKDAENVRKGAVFFGWTTGLGATVGAAGLILYLVQGSGSSATTAHAEHTDRAVRVTPAVLPDFAGLSVDGHF